MQYRKKPVVIEARQFMDDESGYGLLHWVNDGQHKNGRKFATWENGVMIIPTLEGDHTANKGDFIIRGVQGEFYPCKPDIFEMTYDEVNNAKENN